MAEDENRVPDVSQFSEGYIVVETFRQRGEPSTSDLRVRPVKSEGFPANIRVQCSKAMRKAHPVGTKFRIWVTKRGGMLSTNNRTDYEVVTEEFGASEKASLNVAVDNDAYIAQTSPTSDGDELSRSVGWIMQEPNRLLTKPLGVERPLKSSDTISSFKRCPQVVAWVRLHSEGVCELCNSEAPFRDAYGQPFLEVHHVIALADGGADTVENAVAICPNCHRAAHLSENKAELTMQIYDRVPRLRR